MLYNIIKGLKAGALQSKNKILGYIMSALWICVCVCRIFFHRNFLYLNNFWPAFLNLLNVLLMMWKFFWHNDIIQKMARMIIPWCQHYCNLRVLICKKLYKISTNSACRFSYISFDESSWWFPMMNKDVVTWCHMKKLSWKSEALPRVNLSVKISEL